MPYLKQYIQTLEQKGDNALAQSVLKMASEIGKQHFGRNFYYRPTQKIALLSGNDQTEKVSHILGLICQGADQGLFVFLILTRNSNAVQEQMFQRVKEDLEGFDVYTESDDIFFENNRLKRPSIVVLKRNAQVLRRWIITLASCGFLKGNPLFMIDIDDKAGFINTLINKGEKSSIFERLERIRNLVIWSLYLQVTETSQARLLQSKECEFHPSFQYSLDTEGDSSGQDLVSDKKEKQK